MAVNGFNEGFATVIDMIFRGSPPSRSQMTRYGSGFWVYVLRS